jgi:predicted HD superfamily hydrolase involved in NAD metabolism
LITDIPAGKCPKKEYQPEKIEPYIKSHGNSIAFGGNSWRVDKEKARIAALLHDFAKNMNKDELFNLLQESGEKILPLEKAEAELLHGPAAAIIAKRDFGIEDQEILESIKYHTTGNPGLSDLAKIIYLADAIEPSREYPGISEIRKAAEMDLDKAFLMSLNSTLEFLIPRDRLIHPASIEARNEILLKRKLNEE